MRTIAPGIRRLFCPRVEQSDHSVVVHLARLGWRSLTTPMFKECEDPIIRRDITHIEGDVVTVNKSWQCSSEHCDGRGFMVLSHSNKSLAKYIGKKSLTR